MTYDIPTPEEYFEELRVNFINAKEEGRYLLSRRYFSHFLMFSEAMNKSVIYHEKRSEG